MNPTVTTIHPAELVLNFDLYPRHQIDTTNVKTIRQAREAGIVLPPVIAWKKNKNVTDGFHRITDALRAGLREIRVEWRDYPDKAAALEDAIRLNAHGRQLSPYDKARCIQLAERYNLTKERLSMALGMAKDKVADLELRKTAIGPDEQMMPIKATLRDKAQEHITERQQEGNKKAGGMYPLAYVNQVINLLESDLVSRENDNLMAGLQRLHILLGDFLGETPRRKKRRRARAI